MLSDNQIIEMITQRDRKIDNLEKRILNCEGKIYKLFNQEK
jgi:hypothetical protein